MRASSVLPDRPPPDYRPLPRLILDAGIFDAAGDPRPCIRWPGRAVPVAYASLTDAIAAMGQEVAHG